MKPKSSSKVITGHGTLCTTMHSSELITDIKQTSLLGSYCNITGFSIIITTSYYYHLQTSRDTKNSNLERRTKIHPKSSRMTNDTNKKNDNKE